MNFESLFVNPSGRTSRSEFVSALITLLAVVVFYAYLVGGRTGQWSLFVLLFPAFILHARRLHDMGYTAWLLLVPTLLMVAAFAIWLQIVNFGAQLEGILPITALIVATAFALWGCVAKSRPAVALLLLVAVLSARPEAALAHHTYAMFDRSGTPFGERHRRQAGIEESDAIACSPSSTCVREPLEKWVGRADEFPQRLVLNPCSFATAAGSQCLRE